MPATALSPAWSRPICLLLYYIIFANLRRVVICSANIVLPGDAALRLVDLHVVSFTMFFPGDLVLFLGRESSPRYAVVPSPATANSWDGKCLAGSAAARPARRQRLRSRVC